MGQEDNNDSDKDDHAQNVKSGEYKRAKRNNKFMLIYGINKKHQTITCPDWEHEERAAGVQLCAVAYEAGSECPSARTRERSMIPFADYNGDCTAEIVMSSSTQHFTIRQRSERDRAPGINKETVKRNRSTAQQRKHTDTT